MFRLYAAIVSDFFSSFSGSHTLLVLIIAVGCISCHETKTMEEMKPYDGPVMQLDTMELVYSDSAIMRVRLKAPKQDELQNGNREFTKGVLVEFYDEEGVISATLTANFARFYKDANKYMVSGNVIVTNIREKKQLNTEEMFWLPLKHRILVERDKEVRVTTQKEIITGKGLEAEEDFSWYKMYKVTGLFPLP